jgi:hypothetical protein
MRYRLRTLLTAVLALSIAIAIGWINFIDYKQVVGSHPADIIAVFSRYQVVWGVALCVALATAILLHRKVDVAPQVLFCVVAFVGLIVNLLLPFGLL